MTKSQQHFEARLKLALANGAFLSDNPADVRIMEEWQESLKKQPKVMSATAGR